MMKIVICLQVKAYMILHLLWVTVHTTFNHNYRGYQFTSANMDIVKKCYDTFVPKDLNLTITHDGKKCRNSIYKFTIPLKHADKVQTLIDRFEYDIETKQYSKYFIKCR